MEIRQPLGEPAGKSQHAVERRERLVVEEVLRLLQHMHYLLLILQILKRILLPLQKLAREIVRVILVVNLNRNQNNLHVIQQFLANILNILGVKTLL